MNAVEYYTSLEYDERYWRDIRFLTKVAADFVEKHYNLELSIPIVINGRIGKILGRFARRAGEKKSLRIELNKNMTTNASKQDICSTLIHELIHYALFELDKPYLDGEEYFENELRKHGGCSTYTKRPKMERCVYVCEKCDNVVALKFRRSNALVSGNYQSSCCTAGIKYAGKKIM